MFVLPSLVVLDIVLNNTKKKNLQKLQKKLSSTATAQNWTLWTREVCDFFYTSSGHAKKYTKTCKSSVSTYNQPNMESTQNQHRFLRLKFWALVSLAFDLAICRYSRMSVRRPGLAGVDSSNLNKCTAHNSCL
jgi:hypothetical protein